MAKYSLEIRANAFNDWLSGLSQAEIANKYHIPKPTIESWAYKEKWTEKKASRIAKIQNSFAMRFEKKILLGAEAFFDISLMIATICKKKLQSALQRDNPQITKVANDALRGVQIYKAVMPDAPEQTAKQIAEELRKLKENE